MAENQLNIPRSGMKFSSPSTLKDSEYPVLVNGNIVNFSGDFLLISNEPSNRLVSRFNEGFKCIGTYIVPSLSITFFFLTNPATQESEIGFLYDAVSPDRPDVIGVDGKILEQPPLETTIQNPISVYNTFVNANCLDFDIDHPVTSWVKIDDCNVRIYFNDFKNVPRYIDYKDFPKINVSNCPLIETDQLDCDKIKIFPETCYPVVETVDVISGGTNKAGTYQFAICYADVNSNKITDYFYVTNPTPLFDKAITVNTDYDINKSFKLRITNLNTDFKYFNLAVIKTINNTTSVQLAETFEVNSDNFTYIYTGTDKNIQQDLDISDIITKRPHYNKAKITTESNGYLILTNLEEKRIINLQPKIKDIPIYWQTVEMDEGQYSNPIIAQNNVGYLGDEVYPFGMSVTFKDGTQSNVFAFVNREATPYDLEDVEYYPCGQEPCINTESTPSGCPNPDVITNSSCDPTKNTQRWQVYNTASTSGTPICITPSGVGDIPIPITDEVECYSEEILFNSLDVTNPINPDGSYNYVTVPTFWNYPPNTVTYPPQGSVQIKELYDDWLNLGTLDINDFYQNDMCACDINDPRFEPYKQADPAATVVTDPLNPVVNPYIDDSNIEIISEESISVLNTYTTLGSVPDAQNYPYTPTPCKKSDGTSVKDEDYEVWLEAKTNWTFNNSELIVQSSSNQCAIDTWGAFLNADVSGDPADSWYTFYCVNPDGAVGITISTNNSGYSVTLYEVTSIGTLGAIIPTSIPASGGYFLYILEQGKQYAVKVTGAFSYPNSIFNADCKKRVFKICIVSPDPTTSVQTIVPGVAKVIKKCVVNYMGVPQNSCIPEPDEFGEFAYWESQETYPCNEEVWGDLAGKPIRHFKFPDHKIKPFYEEVGSTPNLLTTKLNKIYPKGIVVDIKRIKLAIDQAVVDGLITNEERNSICGYRIYRGNRRGNQSIIAKGLFYDVWQYTDNIYNTGNKVLFPNFPFNDHNPNIFIKNKPIKNIVNAIDTQFVSHPYSDFRNNKYTFHSPNTSFNNPGLGTEVKFEFEQNGLSVGSFNELKNNTKYQYIGAGIISAAIGFASVEAAFEALNTMVNATLTIPITIFGSGTSLPLGLILALVGENIMSPIRMYSHYAEWYEIIKKFAPFKNYGMTYSSVGKYLGYEDNCIGNYRRTIANAQYIKPGIINVKTTKGNSRFNNFKRESSVFIELTQDSFFRKTASDDTSRKLPADCNISTGVTGNIASYYGALKNQDVSQYGQIDNIQWIDTGYNGRIDWNNSEQDTLCDTIFGGDTYINRFSFKRKIPMFLENRVLNSTTLQVANTNLDIQMSVIPNVGYPRFFMNYPTSLDYTGVTQALFGDVAVLSRTRADYNFLCFSESGNSWADAGLASAILGSFAAVSFGVISLPIAVGIISGTIKRDLGNTVFINGKYIDSLYGIASFLTESDYNLDYRHGENFKERNFYPNVGDVNEWTQEYNIPISEDNYYTYNADYSKQNNENPNFVLNNDFNQVKEDCKVQYPNRTIYSLQDNDQNDKFDGNLIFQANNFYDFPKSSGKVLIVKGLDSGVVLVVQENQASAFNSYISLETNINTSAVGQNTIFNKNLPAQFIKTDLGFGGSQTPAVITTEFGTYWVDNKRGQVLQYKDGIQNIVKPDEEWWFKENLPFHILEDFPEFDITNNFKYLGMALAYDARTKRILITKRDVQLKREYRNLVTYDGTVFRNGDEIFTVESDKYFCNKSWTIGYNPLLKSFISFYTFIPNYYVSNQAYFLSGMNYSFDYLDTGSSVWGHNLTKQSYNVFYGKLNPFILEYVIPSKFQNTMLESVKYTTEYYRYQDNNNSGLIPEKTFSQALVYNQRQSSGMLDLIVKQKNNRQQSYLYSSGQQNANSRSILTEKINGEWQFNNFYNVAVYNSGQPIMNYECNNIAYKELNPLSISYKPQYLKEKMVSDYHVIRLIENKHSNYNILNRYQVTKTELYDK